MLLFLASPSAQRAQRKTKGNSWSVSLIQSKFKCRSLAEFSEAQRKSKTYLVSYAVKGKGKSLALTELAEGTEKCEYWSAAAATHP
jgi:hypothetical protein